MKNFYAILFWAVLTAISVVFLQTVCQAAPPNCPPSRSQNLWDGIKKWGHRYEERARVSKCFRKLLTLKIQPRSVICSGAVTQTSVNFIAEPKPTTAKGVSHVSHRITPQP